MVKIGDNKFRGYIKYILIFLSLVFVVLVFLLAREIVSIKRADIISIRKIEFSNFLKSHSGPLTIDDVSIVAPWMTFDYVNKLFDLPSGYFKTSLGISNPRYPQISISGYAKSEQMNTTTFLSEVQAALRNYLISKKS